MARCPVILTKVTLVVSIVSLIYAVGVLAFVRLQHPTDLSAFSLIHMPASGKCPEGFTIAPGVFEKGGKSYAGCARIGVQPDGGMVDRLDPGEGIQISIPLEGPSHYGTPLPQTPKRSVERLPRS